MPRHGHGDGTLLTPSICSGTPLEGGFPWGPMSCLAMLEGVQPLLMKRCVPSAVDRRSIVVAAESMKLMSALALVSGGAAIALRQVVRDWLGVLRRAGLPAALFALQNFFLQIAYPRLDSLLFMVVGQTKVLSVALVGRLLLGKRQSVQQCLALGMLTGAAVATWEPTKTTGNGGANSGKETGVAESTQNNGPCTVNSLAVREEQQQSRRRRQIGLAAQLTANALSGLNAALVELSLRGRDPLAFNVELSVCGVLSALIGMSVSTSSLSLADLLTGWHSATALAPMALAANGLVTGFVIKGGGGIAKAFASVGAIMVTSVLRSVVEGQPLSHRQTFVAVPLAVSGVVVYSRYPALAR